mgnify:FL=1
MDQIPQKENRNPYKGLHIICLLIIGIPYLLYRGFIFVMLNAELLKDSPVMIECEARCLAGVIGICLCCVTLIEALGASMNVVLKRWGEVLFALRYESLAHAIKWWWMDFKDHGGTLWIYLILIAINVLTFINGAKDFLRIAH